MTNTTLLGRPQEAWAPYQPSDEEPWDARRVAHLRRRAGFGASWETIARDVAAGPADSIKRALAGDDHCPDGRAAADFESLAAAMDRSIDQQPSLARLQVAWLYRIVYSPFPLRERMVLAWHAHFATSFAKADARALAEQNRAQRDLWRAPVSQLHLRMLRDPAMLVWLDGVDSQKEQPNENLGREFLELFALGEGNYTEQDVKETARALTGWQRMADSDELRMLPSRHDAGAKTLLGETGAWADEDVVRLACRQPAAARHVARRLWRMFIADCVEPTPELLETLAVAMRVPGDVDVAKGIETVLRSRLFHSQECRSWRVASPVEYVACALRSCEAFAPCPDLMDVNLHLCRMGQHLFEPPNVAGWPGGLEWLRPDDRGANKLCHLAGRWRRRSFARSFFSRRPASRVGGSGRMARSLQLALGARPLAAGACHVDHQRRTGDRRPGQIMCGSSQTGTLFTRGPTMLNAYPRTAGSPYTIVNAQEIAMFSRRQFIAQASLGGGLVCLGNLTPPAWARAAAAPPKRDARMLVVVELDGGNDGLNTVVPYADDIYHRNRPTLRVAPKDVLKLDDHLGLHPTMTGLAKLWENGNLRIVNNVGYPNPSRSHSRALEIWRGGKLLAGPTGWLGRVADKHQELSLCHVGGGAVPLAVRQQTGAATSLSSFDDLRLRGDARIAVNDPAAGNSALAQIAARFDAAAVLAERMNRHGRGQIDAGPAARLGKGDKPNALTNHLAIVRALMEQGDEFRIFYTSTSGFDTHANQGFRHRQLLKEVSEAIFGFLDEIGKSGLSERVVVLVFSEFGRRLRENGQRGTDHGAAAPVLLAGQAVKGGFLGGPPDLTKLDAGDVAYKVDYRDLYASLLRQWLDIDPAPVLGERVTSLEVV